MEEKEFRNKITCFSFFFSILVIWAHSYNGELFLGKTHQGKTVLEAERFLGDGLRYEISDFLSMINGSSRSEYKLTRGDSVALAGVMEKFLETEGREMNNSAFS